LSFAELVTIGRVVKPQGRKGEVLVESLSDRQDRFPTLRRVYLEAPSGGARAVAVAGCWRHKGRYVLKLDGVDGIAAAEALRGSELRISERELEPLPEGSYYHHQLRGLRVRAGERELGAVAEVLDTGAGAAVLVVRGAGGELLVPFAAGFVRRVDLEARRIEVLPAETVEC
jgi:16S rRNA processing protein RimM